MTPPLFTVCTPTHDRAHTLGRVMQSLRAQTLRDFEWIVVDDGSTDGTAALVKGWLAERDVPITFLRQPHGGKHIAINNALDHARGALFLIADSDDAFVPHALERMAAVWDGVVDKAGFTGVLTLCQDATGRILGRPFPDSPIDGSALELEPGGERWGFHRTDVLRRFRFPADHRVRFVPETIVWHAIARHYRLRCINEPLRIYTDDAGGQLTEAALGTRAAVYRYYRLLFFRDFDRAERDPARFARLALLYWRYRWHLGRGDMAEVRASCAHLGSAEERGPAWLLFALAAAPGWLLFLIDRLRGRRA